MKGVQSVQQCIPCGFFDKISSIPLELCVEEAAWTVSTSWIRTTTTRQARFACPARLTHSDESVCLFVTLFCAQLHRVVRLFQTKRDAAVRGVEADFQDLISDR